MSDERVPPRGRLRQHVAEEIRVLLARRRMSAAELARRTGIKQSTMSRRMTGETAFDMDDLEAIANVLDVEVADLMPKGVKTGVEFKDVYGSLSRTADTECVKPLAQRPIGGPRRDSTRPPSTKRGNKIRPGNTRPSFLPRAS